MKEHGKCSFIIVYLWGKSPAETAVCFNLFCLAGELIISYEMKKKKKNPNSIYTWYLKDASHHQQDTKRQKQKATHCI